VNFQSKCGKPLDAFMLHAETYQRHVPAYALMKPLVLELESIAQSKAPKLYKLWKEKRFSRALCAIGENKLKNDKRGFAFRCLEILLHLSKITPEKDEGGLFGKLTCYGNFSLF
jgi:hypothetical protein